MDEDDEGGRNVKRTERVRELFVKIVVLGRVNYIETHL